VILSDTPEILGFMVLKKVDLIYKVKSVNNIHLKNF
jgi:hypothetical protein